MKRLLCGTEQCKTSILINRHFFFFFPLFFFALQDEWGWSGGVLKGSCAAFGKEGRGLEEEPCSPAASFLDPLVPFTAAWEDAKTGGGGVHVCVSASVIL